MLNLCDTVLNDSKSHDIGREGVPSSCLNEDNLLWLAIYIGIPLKFVDEF